MRSLLISLALLAAAAQASPPRDACDAALENELFADFRRDHARLDESALRELTWSDHEDYAIARPVDPDLYDKISLRIERNGLTAEWDASLMVLPKGFPEWDAVSHAFEAMQKRRFFEVGFKSDSHPGEVPKGIVANFSGDAATGEADVEDAFKVLATVFKALRGQLEKPKLN